MDSAMKSLMCEKCQNAKVRGLTFAMRISSAEIYVCLKCAMQHAPMLKRSIATALVVGTILVMLNQGDLIFSGQRTSSLLWKIPLTYLVPFMVSTWGALTNARR